MSALAALLARPIAHRGLHGGGTPPIENTLEAARAAIAHGYNIECDVRLTRDGRLIVFHDADLQRLAGAAQAVADLTAAELGGVRLPDEQAVPTLDALLDLVGMQAVLAIEVKATPGEAARVAAALAEALERFPGLAVVESFEPRVLRACFNLRAIPIGLVGADARALDRAAELPRCDFLSWQVDALAAAKARFPEMPLTAWTVRSPAQRALAQENGAQIVFEGFLP